MSTFYRPLNVVFILGRSLILVPGVRQQSLANSDEVTLPVRYNHNDEITVVSTNAQAKSTTGSGFQTNVKEPVLINHQSRSGYIDPLNTHSIQCSNNEEVQSTLKPGVCADFDVFMGLAIPKCSNLSENYFSFSSIELPEDELVHASGNYKDQRQLQYPATSNGTVAHSFDNRVLFKEASSTLT